MKFTQDFKLSLKVNVKDLEAIKQMLSLESATEEEVEEALEERFIKMIEAFQKELEYTYSGGDEEQEAVVKVELM